MMNVEPDFEALKAKRDAAIQQIAREMWETLGGDPNVPPTFHSRDYAAECYCACPDGPCQHEWGGWREHDDGLGGEQFCQRCGEGAMSHGIRTCPF